MTGRTSIAKSVNISDPLCIQGFRELMTSRPVKVVKDVGDLQLQDANYPFVWKKGRNVMRALTQNDDQKTVLENTVNEFRKTCLSSTVDKNVKLACISTLSFRGIDIVDS